MTDKSPTSRWSLPYETPLTDAPKKRTVQIVLRVAAYIVLVGALITPVVQFQIQTRRNLRRAMRFDSKHPGWTGQDAAGRKLKRPKGHKGAIGRWRKAVRPFWAGENIYRKQEELSGGADAPSDPRKPRVWLHPNMPFVVILLTPFAHLSVEEMAICWSILKLIVLAASLLMVARLAGHTNRRIPDWVLALGAAWSILMMADDTLHGNTNVFVLGAVVFHLWCYRRGRDWLAGIPLALAICVKMTPAIFLLYWAYQRNWKLLAGTAVALMVFAVIIPAAAVGPDHYATLMQSWGENLILPGLIKGAWYPIHINQSISGVFSRYFLDGQNGDIFWNPDDNPYSMQDESGWITLVALSPGTVKMLIRAAQVAVVALLGWAIGWRKLPRDDGRRMLHYGLVVIAMLLLNQRMWDHHATVLLIADVAIWEAVAFGRFSRRVRAGALGLMLATGVVLFSTKSGVVEAVGKLFGKSSDHAETLSDVVKAYGPMFYHLVLLLAAGVLLAVVLRKSDPPYAGERQKLFD